MRSRIGIGLALFLVFSVAVAAPGNTDPAALLDAVKTSRAEIAALEERRAGVSGDDRLVLDRQLARLRLRALTNLHTLMDAITAGNVASPSYRESVTPIAERVADTIPEVIARTATELEALRTQRSEGGDTVQIDAQIADARLLLDNAYGALKTHLDKMERMGFDVIERRGALVEDLRTRSSEFADRLELEVERRKALEAKTGAGDAAGRHALKSGQARIQSLSKSLTVAIDLLDELGIATANLRQRQIKATGQLTSDILDTEVAGGLLQGWTVELREGLARNLPRWLFQLLVFVAILAVFRILSIVARRLAGRALTASSFEISQLMHDMIVSVVSKGVMVLGLLVALSQLGLSIGPLLAGLGVVGFIVGFALQDTLSNFAAGMMILIYRPFDVADAVEAGGVSGKVDQMNLVSTTILTFDNQTLVVPNSKIWGGVIKNVTSQTERRVDLTFGIGYGDDVEKAERILREIVTSHPKVLAEPAPNIRLHKLGESSVDFIVRPWASTDDYWDVYWDLTREVKLRFDREGITIPFPQRDVHLIREGDAR